MDQDEVIFLGAAVLLAQVVSQLTPDHNEIKTAVLTARHLRAEVSRQLEEARAKLPPGEPKKS
jgi:hypothetical protein